MKIDYGFASTSKIGRLVPIAIVTHTLSGCAYRDISPEAALADERANSGFSELQEVGPGTAKVVLRTAGAAYPVRFSVSTSAEACQGFSKLGNAAFAGRGVVYPWIANAVQRTSRADPYLVHEAAPGKALQVRGDGTWSSGTGLGYRSGRCGPLVSSFTPQDGRAYTVEFVWGDQATCKLVVMDATNPDAPLPVPTQAIAGCSASNP